MPNNKPLTKTDLNNALQKQDKKWDKKFDEARKDTINFFQTSIIPTLDEILKKFDSIENIAENHGRRLEKNEDKLFNHEQRIGSLENKMPLSL